MDLHLHDLVELKKPHPCGSVQWEILRVGMDIKLRCQGCPSPSVGWRSPSGPDRT